MGGSVSHLWSSLWPKKEHQILMYGLFNSGKTTILYTQLKNWGPIDTVPTTGFNVEILTYKNMNFSFWDLGGRDKLRPVWGTYFINTAAIIFVVDATEIGRLDDAAYELTYLLNFEGLCEVRNAPLLVFANKQDLEGAKSPVEISEALKLGELRDRPWNVIACCAIDGTGIAEGMDWLVQVLRSRKT